MYQNNYNFKRLSKEGETCWEDVIKRFINEMIKRGCKTSKEDLDWALLNFYVLPNSPALSTAGNDKFYASACSSYPVVDSMDDGEFSILNTLKISSMATKAGIGTGFNFSSLRSKEESVKGRKGTTGGPVSFLRAYNGFIREITQATRKSASMGLLHINHPDIEDYINCKVKDGDIENFNLSVVIDDKFMEAVEKDEDYELIYRNQSKVKKVKARELFDLMCKRMWENGEPGVMFADNIKKDYFENLCDCKILANPCSEALLSYGDDWLELCVLASINLPKYLELDKKDRQRVIDITVSMLNDIIDIQDYVTPLQERGMKYINRKIGIGVAGLATVLAKENIKYSSDDSYDFTKKIFKEIGGFAKDKSEQLFKERENSGWEQLETIAGGGKRRWFRNYIDSKSPLNMLKRLNASLLSVAPTSSLSNIFNDINEEGCSYGIEPYFTIDPYIIHNSFGDFEKKEKIVDIFGLEKAKAIIETANELDYKSHLKPVQAYYDANWGLGITQGCSKTLNFKNNVTVDEIKESVIYCWKSKIKAISFYKDGSRKGQVMVTKDSYKDCIELDSNGRPIDIFCHQSPKRPEFLECDIVHTICNKQSWLVLIGLYKGKPYEIFAGLEENISIPKKYKQGRIQKKKGYHLIVGEGDDELVIKDIPSSFKNPEFASLTRLVSFSLRHGGPLRFVVEQLQKEGGFDTFNKAVSRCLKKYISDNEDSKGNCPNCNGTMKYISGCPTCVGSEDKPGCGYSKCS
jgi:ribonucleoside-diphosphate reductase alpha chain